MTATLIETEGNVERLMRNRRADAHPYLQDKAQDLLARSNTINGELSTLQSQMLPTLNSWKAELQGRKSELNSFQTQLRRVGSGTTMTVLDWILTFGGTLKTSITGTKSEATAAINEVEAAISTVTRRISALEGYIEDLSKRQKTAQLSQWASGSNLDNMAEEVARSFGIDQRDMLQGWWDQKYLDDWKAVGGLKPWQPVCDLYESLITPRSWADIERWRATHGSRGPRTAGSILPGYGAYGTMTATGTEGGGANYVYFRQPRPGQSGYRSLGLHANQRTDPWGKSLLENGCVPGQACPVLPFTSPITRTLGLIAIQTYGMKLMQSSKITDEITAIDSALNTARTKLDRAKKKFKVLKGAVQGAGSLVKPKIKLGLESTGGPSALRAGLATGGATVGGPIGAVVGWLAGEVAIGVAVGEIWDRLTSGVSTDKARMDRAKDDFSPIRTRTRASARWWKNNTSSSWRSNRNADMASIQVKLIRWKVIYNGMKPTIRSIYPSRTKFQWRNLGVDDPCMERAPDFEDPGDWRPPVGVGPGVWRGGGGGGVDGGLAGRGGPILTTMDDGFGSIEGIEPQKHFGLTKNQWLLVGAGAAAFYYYKRKK